MLDFVKEAVRQYNSVTKGFGCQASYEYVTYCLNTNKIWSSHNDVKSLNRNISIYYMSDFNCHIGPRIHVAILDYDLIEENVNLILNEVKHCSITIEQDAAHLFNLIRDNNKTYIVDSYAYTRPLSIREIEVSEIFNMLKNKDQEAWNQLFQCNENEVDFKIDMIVIG